MRAVSRPLRRGGHAGALPSTRGRRPTGSISGERRGDPLVPSTQEALDRITYLAGESLGVEVVCASLVDVERHLVVSSYGQPAPTALLLSHAFRTRVLTSRRPLVVADGRHDPQVAHHPVVRDGTVRACVGMPLSTPDGRAVGTLLALDQRPRRWTGRQIEILAELAALIVSEIELAGAVRRASLSDVSSKSVPVM
jgi:GAF domain-containing protein